MSRVLLNLKKNGFFRNLLNFKVINLRYFFTKHPLIIFLRYNGTQTYVSAISNIRIYSLIYNFKVYMLNSNQVKGFMPSVDCFKFLTKGRCILLGFLSWVQLKNVLMLPFFEELKKCNIITISFQGYFFNLLRYKKQEIFDWLVDYCKNISANELIIYNNINIIIYVIVCCFYSILINILNILLTIK